MDFLISIPFIIIAVIIYMVSNKFKLGTLKFIMKIIIIILVAYFLWGYLKFIDYDWRNIFKIKL